VPRPDESDVRSAVREFGYPVVLKPVSSWGRGTRLVAQAAVNVDEALREVERIHIAGLRVLVQQWLPGRRDAVSVFCTAGKIWARFAQTSHREFPPLGGVSVLSESISPLRDIVEPAEALVRAADLDGCSMVEFRRDREGHPVLMEVNSRLPGSVALAIAAGVDFPQLLYTWASGKPLREIPEYRVGVRQRWLSGDISHLKYVFEGPGRTDTPSRGRAVATFLYDFIRRPSAIDGLDSGDLGPSLVELRHGILEPILGETLRVASGRSRGSPGRTGGAKEA
jgi:predicted ATP-grasp superfamily ATP-dependent carboligase